MGVSTQDAEQLVDTLVARGYLERSLVIEDRRRLVLNLTDKGRAAADVIRSAVAEVDAQLVGLVGEAYVSHTLKTLAVLVESERGLSPA
jgi:DNA-binding MarR family transcriptional regulator